LENNGLQLIHLVRGRETARRWTPPSTP